MRNLLESIKSAHLFFFLLLLFTSNSALAYDVYVNGIYYNLSNQVATITYGHIDGTSTYKGDLVLVSSFTYNNKTYTVTRIGSSAFENCNSLSSITIPNTITRIDNNAFKGCTNLTKITLLDGDTDCYIGNHDAYNSLTQIHNFSGMFKDCTKLESLYYGRNVTYNTNTNIHHPYPPFSDTNIKSVVIGDNIKTIGNKWFMYCGSLESVTLSNASKIESIGDQAFYSCSALKTITIPKLVTSISNNAFINCNKLSYLTWNAENCASTGNMPTDSLKSVVLGNTVKFLPSDFCKNAQIEEIIIPQSLKRIGNNSFSNCVKLKKVTISDLTAWCNIDFQNSSNPLRLAHHLYLNGNEIINLTIPNAVKEIKYGVFEGCIGLKNLTIGNSVTSIGSNAFASCTGMTNVTMGNSITNIDDYAFYGCTGLKKVIISDLKAWCNITFASTSANPLASARHLYLNGNEIKQLVIPESVTSVKSFAFYGCVGLTSLSMGNSVTSIGNGSFRGCSGLTSASIGNSVTVIGQNAFNGCSGMTTVSIGNSVQEILSQAFSYCNSLNRVNISSLEAWCRIAFEYESGSDPIPSNPLRYAHHLYLNSNEVKALNIPNTITTIGVGTFFGCTGLTSVSIPNSVKTINNFAFYGCTGIKSISLPNSLTSIGEKSFMECNGVTKIVIPNSVTTIGSDAFNYCTSITDANIGNGVTTVGSGAFRNCTSLGHVTIGTAVKTIGPSAFNNCTALTNVDFNATRCNSFTSSNHPFNTCSLEKITIGNMVEAIPAYFAYSQKSLTKIHIPGNVSSIGSYAFAECSNLAWVVVTRPTPPSGYTNMFPANQLIYVPNFDKYNSNSYWKPFNLKGMYNVEPLLTMATINGISDIRLVCATYDDNLFMASKNAVTIKGLLPNNSNEVSVTLNIGSDLYEFNDIITTKAVEFGTLQANATQTTLNTSFTVNRDEDFVIEACGVSCNSNDRPGSINETTSDKYTIGCKITSLSFNTTYSCKPWVQYKGEKYYGKTTSLRTAAVGVSTNGTVGPTSVNYTATYSAGDAHVTNAYFTFQGEQSKDLKQKGLEPNRNYNYSYTIVTGNGYQSNSYSFKTPVLTMSTQTARMLTNTTAMFIAETNMADEETSCGFEWRRYDAPDEMPSTKVYCPVYGGVMAGTLKRMTENVYYKYRPFYRSSTGNEYYGNWIAFITADAGVEFEPVVYTYNSPAVSQNDATLQGVALRGSDEITEQGFEYWKSGSSSTLNAGNNIIKVNATGERMSATVNNLAPGTKYVFRAFVTAGGKTKRGAEVQFVTLSSSMDVNGDGEINIADVNSIVNAILIHKGDNIYDVNGDGEINIADINAIIQSILSGK